MAWDVAMDGAFGKQYVAVIVGDNVTASVGHGSIPELYVGRFHGRFFGTMQSIDAQ